MKKIIFFGITLFILFQSNVSAKNPEEDSLTQLIDVQKMIGKEITSSSTKGDEGLDATSLILSMIWGSIGTGYFIYGKKQAKAAFLICGVGLCLFPLVVSGNVWSIVLGLIMTFVPYKID